MTRILDLATATLAGAGILTTRLFALQATDVPTPDKVQLEFIQWALKEGGLLVVVIVIVYFYRRDFRTAHLNSQAQTNALLHVVQANIAAVQKLEATNDRLARAVEDQNSRRRKVDQ